MTENTGTENTPPESTCAQVGVKRLVSFLWFNLKSFSRFAFIFAPLWLFGAYLIEFKFKVTGTTGIMFCGWVVFEVSQKLAAKFDNYFTS